MIRNRIYGSTATVGRRTIGTDGAAMGRSADEWIEILEPSSSSPGRKDWVAWGCGCGLVCVAGAFACGVLLGLFLGGFRG